MSGSALLRAGVAGLALTLLIDVAQAYGPAGHLIAGRAAESMLCTRARSEIARLGEGQDLGELGLWADQIRSNPAYADAAPWHYVNVADDSSVAAFEHPPEGDVLWAIEHFRDRLADTTLADSERAEALKFLVHFVVDLHQPIHVGRAEDRGGNAVELLFRGETTNLHRFWDTDAIDWADASLTVWTENVRSLTDSLRDRTEPDPRVWAEESFELRSAVYSFGTAGSEPNRAYKDQATAITRERLVLGAVRLAATLNAIFCSPEQR